MKPLQVSLIAISTMPLQPVLTRLGYRKKTELAGKKETYFSALEQLIREIKVRTFHVESGVQIENDVVKLDGYLLASSLVRRRVEKSSSVFLLGASALKEDVARIQGLKDAGDLEKAVMLDAVLSEKVDYALGFLKKEIAVDLRRTGRHLGTRISCGYGDFSLAHQKYFYKQLHFQEYGITLNEQNILSPEKAVTALIPVYMNQEEK